MTDLVSPVPNVTDTSATRMRRALDGFYRLLMGLSALAMVGCFVCVVAGIADRQFAWGLRGLDSYAGYSIAAALFLGLPGTLQRGEHIRVTLVLQQLPKRWRAALEFWCLAAAMGLSGALAWCSARMVWVSQTMHDVSQASDATPLWIPQLAMALGCAGLLVAFVDASVARLRGFEFFRSPSAAEAAHAE